MCHWGTIGLGSFEVLSDHGDEMEDDDSTNETTEMMPRLPSTLCNKWILGHETQERVPLS